MLFFQLKRKNCRAAAGSAGVGSRGTARPETDTFLFSPTSLFSFRSLSRQEVNKCMHPSKGMKKCERRNASMIEPQAPEQAPELRTIRASEITPREVKWLWYPYIPLGKVTLLQGDPGDSKSQFALALAALLSWGEPPPFAGPEAAQPPLTVIYQTTEDDTDDTRSALPGFDPALCCPKNSTAGANRPGRRRTKWKPGKSTPKPSLPGWRIPDRCALCPRKAKTAEPRSNGAPPSAVLFDYAMQYLITTGNLYALLLILRVVLIIIFPVMTQHQTETGTCAEPDRHPQSNIVRCCSNRCPDRKSDTHSDGKVE